jgi:hypothetical protein
MMRAAALGTALLATWLASSPGRAAEGTRDVHGSADAFAQPGIALAWGVLRAPKEDDTAVVLRLEPDTRAYAWVEVVGRDPFTQGQAVLFPATEVAGAFDVRILRTRFADHPRTEIRLWPRDRPPPSAPALSIYFAGVPDTTPEVVRADELDRSLGTRIERARAESRRIAP